MNLNPIAIAGLGLFASLYGQIATADLALAQKSGCTVCHSVDAAIVGPAYKDVAAKYKGDDGAPARLAAKVKAGGSGNWGEIPMPPNVAVSDENIKALVDWILTL
ncbi:cytochrome c class I [Thiorhodococcus drewsii AZ1]|uniref:Cytochrome c-551 n=1 Tax=Thiorhodococcus drewsii AZ1 TaxID=765913 RepID=G2E7W3_9GAMM|nr:c-type cytochrome [Thiorhodococcus drewsii]EGV27803.1 cytochrome c class I [Thiorhodococcus drewsii AZ1]